MVRQLFDCLIHRSKFICYGVLNILRYHCHFTHLPCTLLEKNQVKGNLEDEQYGAPEASGIKRHLPALMSAFIDVHPHQLYAVIFAEY